MLATVVQRWLMDQFIGNVVTVAQPGFTEQFTKLPDGTYNPPPTSAATLRREGSAFEYTTKSQDRLSFNTSGNLASLIKASGSVLTLSYSGTPEVLSSVSNNLGRSLSLAYTSGLLSSVTDSSGRSVSYVYDSNKNLTRFTDVLGNVTSYVYDQPGRLTQIFTPALPTIPTVTNRYDSLGRIMTQHGAGKPEWQYFFALARTEEVDPFGSRHVLYSTDRGKTRLEIRDLGGLNLPTANAYDALDRLVSSTSPEGKTASYTYDIRNNILTSTLTPKPGSPLSPLVTTYTYDPVYNKPTRIVDPLGLVTTSTYDSQTGNLSTVTADAGAAPHFNATTSFTYNSFGQVATVTDPLGVITRNTYDSFGNLTSTTRDPGGAGHANQVTLLAYDPVGNVITSTDPKGNVTTTTYDPARRPIQVVSPSTSASPGGIVSALSYDAEGRVTQTRQSVGGTVLRTTSTTYTPTGKPQDVTDANGNVTRMTYDAVDRLATVTDAEGRATRTTYDALGRRSAVYNNAIQANALVQFGYTPDGPVGSITDANGNTTGFAYDGFDRLATTTYPGGSTETLTYDANSNVLTRKTRANQTITFTYDTLNRLSTKAPPSPAATVTYGYDLANRLTRVSDNSSSVTAAVPPSGTSVQYTTRLSYDPLNRPTGISWDPAPAQAAPSTGSVTFGHAYNKVNQRTGQTVTDNTWLEYPAATPSSVSYAANALNQYSTVGGVTLTYDNNGNLTFDGTFTLGYDAENRLISASGAGNSAAYAYDAQGRRKSKTVNGTTTAFVTAADNREVLEYDGSTGAVLRWYAYGLGTSSALSQMNVAVATRTMLVPAQLGSVISTIDSNSGVITKVNYLPYGASSSAAGTFRFTGQRIDAETNGLYYYRGRTYSPALGRFVQVDPVRFDGGVNLYAYVFNDPLNLIAPLGLTAAERGAFESFTNYLNSSAEALARIPGDISRTAAEFLDSPVAVTASILNSFPQTRGEGQLLTATAGAFAGSRALVPMVQVMETVPVRMIAGYEVAGNAGLVGQTYNMNIWGLFASRNAQGLTALANSVRAEAAAAGATEISISGNAIINPALANMNPAIAGRLGFSVERINPSTIFLRGPVR